MPIINFILFLLFIYLIVYSIYLLTLNFKAFSSKAYLKEMNYLRQMNLKEHNLCVIIWANSKHKRLKDLLEALNSQTYNKVNYSIHVIVQRDNDNKGCLPECVYGSIVHYIENPEFFSKDKALTTFIEKLLPENKHDAYVFIGADRLVGETYLENVNSCLYDSNSAILSGATEIRNPNCNLKSKILNAKQNFVNNTLYISRRMFELATVIDADNCVIPSDILEKTGRVCFETKNDELKYSLFLASNDIKPIYCPFIVTSVDAENYDATTANVQSRYSLLKYYLPLLPKKPWFFSEFVFSMLKPSALFAMIAYGILLYSSFTFFSSIGLKYVLHLGLLAAFSVLIGLFSSKIKPKEILFLICYPICSLVMNFKIVTKKLSIKGIQEQIKEDENVNSATVNSIVSDGKKDVICKLDLVSEDGMRRVVFRFKKKRFVSDAHLRMYDAMGDISQKLKSKGFSIKVCQNCGHFSSNPDGTVDLLKGFCKAKGDCETPETQVSTLIWNTCPRFMHLEITNIIDNMTNKGI